MKLALVVHRYGAKIAGGSEAHCRAFAQRLASTHDVTVLTSRAEDYQTWRNTYPPGWSQDGAVRLCRFSVTRRRRLERLAELSDLAFSDRATPEEQEAWFKENGPEMPGLLRYLQEQGAGHDRILFWSYRYYHSFFGLPLVADRAVLVPTAEDDPLIRLGVLGCFFSLPAGYLFLTPEEAELVGRRSNGSLPPWCIIGAGLEPPEEPIGRAEIDALGIARPYVLFVGRIEPNKGCDTLLRYYRRYAEETERPARLVMAGPAFMEIPIHPLIKPLGFVTEPLRDALMAHASALIVPSPYESLSLVLLEAWNRGVPALVNGRCRVLKGQVQRANGGLYYDHINEFVEGLRCLTSQPGTARRLGAQGRAYVEREYRWPGVMRKVEAFLRGSVDAADSRQGPSGHRA